MQGVPPPHSRQSSAQQRACEEEAGGTSRGATARDERTLGESEEQQTAQASAQVGGARHEICSNAIMIYFFY